MAEMKPNARVLVIGAGPIALGTIYWARRLGAGPIAVTASSTRRAPLAMKMGATTFLTPGGDLAAEAPTRWADRPNWFSRWWERRESSRRR